MSIKTCQIDSNTTDASLNALFRETTETISQYVARSGKHLTPYRDPSLPHFSKLESFLAKDILRTLLSYRDLIVNFDGTDEEYGDSNHLTWHAVKYFGFTPRSDLFDKIEKGDFVEIYDAGHRQIFRDFNFFDFCSYSLEELVCMPVEETFGRGEKAIAQLGHYQRLFASGKEDNTIIPNIDEHEVWEIQSPNKLKTMMKTKVFSPLKDKSGNTAALAVVASGTLLSENTLVLEPTMDHSNSRPLEIL